MPWFHSILGSVIFPEVVKSLLACLVIFAVKLGEHGEVREAHDGDERQLPRHAEHEDKESDCLDEAAQEQIDILRDEVTHLRGVWGQPWRDVTCIDYTSVSESNFNLVVLKNAPVISLVRTIPESCYNYWLLWLLTIRINDSYESSLLFTDCYAATDNNNYWLLWLLTVITECDDYWLNYWLLRCQ